MTPDFRDRLDRLCRMLGDGTPLDVLVADGHPRFHLYRTALAEGSGCDEATVLEVVGSDPDFAMREAVIVEHVGRVAGAGGPSDLVRWAAAHESILAGHSYARRRVNEWLVVKRLQAGEAVPVTSYRDGSDWLQRTIVREVSRVDALSELASGGRTKRVRAAAARATPAQ